MVWIKHFSSIEDIYNISNCYVFPTVNRKACIETPLSVLEAMACNLPVISTRFGALSEMFEAGGGLHFVSRQEDILGVLRSVRDSVEKATTREKVKVYSWEEVVRKLEMIYDELLR
jgi:glycosyltransferase involved in cell wall biosynthesis